MKTKKSILSKKEILKVLMLGSFFFFLVYGSIIITGCGSDKNTKLKTNDQNAPGSNNQLTENKNELNEDKSLTENKDSDNNGENTSNKNNSSLNESKKQTIKNLMDALKGETTASAKYLAYSKKARDEGHENIALLFEAASKSENVHAQNHRAVLEQLGEKPGEIKPEFVVKSTKENLEDAIKGESFEVSTMYPDYLKVANDGKVSVAMISFNYAYKTETKHKVFYQNALNALLENKENTLPVQYSVCPTCGNTFEGTAPNRCSLSLTSNEKFITIKS